ncbi:hypothetical protein PQX77_005660 [Marasmius sp. AFHP31]|nr:hypothetical protein PQX77_005660 [Marasmius sp. AFHP31]
MLPESQFARVLHTNYIPSTRELGEIRQVVAEPQGRIAKVDEDIARLRAERQELQQFVECHRTLAGPFRRFPVDIWTRIFVHCLPTTNLNVAVCTVKEAPLLLTTVCRAWREIAVNTPRLWSSLHLSVPRPPTSGSEESEAPHPDLHAMMLQGIKLWLSRSGSRPLTLSVETMYEVPPRAAWPGSLVESELGPNHCADFMSLLADYSRRWKVLSLGLAMKALYQWPIEKLVAEDVPLLEAIYTGDFALFKDNFQGPFHPETTHTDSGCAPIANLLCRAPSLCVLHIDPASGQSLHIPLEWGRLTELSLNIQRPWSPGSSSSESPIVVLQGLAQKCLSLVTLIFRCYLPDVSAGITSSSPVELNSLRELSLLFDGQFYTDPDDELDPGPYPFVSSLELIYSSISAPQLLRLTLQLGHNHWGGPAVGDVLPFHVLIRTSPRLTHLRLIGYHILGAKPLSQCLQSATSLITLKLQPGIPRYPYPGIPQVPHSGRGRTPGWVSQFLSSLNIDNNGSIICPRLETFECGRCSQDDIPSILEFLQGEGRQSSLRYFKADMGDVWGKEVDTLTSASLAETLESLRKVHGISVDLEWNKAEPVPDTWQERALERLVADDVPLLETVHTEDTSLFTNINNFLHTPPNALPQAPEPPPTPASSFLCKLSSLRSLHLYQGSMSSLHIPLDWARLTELSFDFQPVTFDSSHSPLAVLRAIAQTCRSLSMLNFRTYLPPAGAHLDPVAWSTLRELRLILDGQLGDYSDHDHDTNDDGPFPFLPHVKDIYSSIIAPQLRRLTLQLGKGHYGGLVADNDLPFHTLIKGAPHLTHLQIIGYHILEAEALSRCLQAAPSLTTLILQPEWSSSPEYGFRSRRSPYQPIAPPTGWVPSLLSSFNELDSCPHLQVFDCARCRPEDVTSILEFIQFESRLSKMKQFRADMADLWGQEIHAMTSPSLIETLRSLRAADGVSVDMKWREAEPAPDYQWRINPYYGLPVPAPNTWGGTDDW